MGLYDCHELCRHSLLITITTLTVPDKFNFTYVTLAFSSFINIEESPTAYFSQLVGVKESCIG